MKQHITVLRIFATLAVLMIHSVAPLLKVYRSDRVGFWVANILDGITHWCVPVFFMISGALLLSKVDDFKKFYTKRLLRVVIPFIIWSAIYLAYQRLYYNESFIMLANKALSGSFYHLPFIYQLIGVYLVAPFLQRWLTVTSRSMLKWILIFWVINMGIIPAINTFTSFNISFSIPMFVDNMGYFLLGYYLETYKPKISISLFYLGFGVMLIGTVVLLENHYKDWLFFYHYFSLSIILMASSIYSFFQRHPFKLPCSSFLDKHSFGVYFIHPLLLEFLRRYTSITPSYIHPVIGTLFIFLILFVSSYLITWMISRLTFRRSPRAI